MDNWIGKTLSKVQIQKAIGRGGMAEVYVGQHTTLNRPMAVKILHAHMTEDSQLRERFEAEAQAVASMRHPNIVQVSDFDVIEGRPYIVMELLEGMTLARYLLGLHGAGSSLPLHTIARLMRSLGLALDYAHQRGVVHRDVKPANIILRQGSVPISPTAPLADDVEPILTDFGVARIADAATRTLSGTILGTPAYMSPEQVQGQRVDARSDIYSLGIILYEMLAGKLPFNPDTDTPASILYKHVHEPPPQLANTHPAIQAVVDRAMAKDKEERYQRAGRMAKDFASAVEAPAATTVRPSSTRHPTAQPTAKPSQIQAARRKRGVPIWAVLAIALIGLGTAAGGIFVVSQLLDTFGPPAVEEPLPVPAETIPAATGEGEQPPPATEPVAPSPFLGAGMALLRASGVEGLLQGLEPAAEGSQYYVWLSRRDGGYLDITDNSPLDGGNIRLAFTAPEGESLLEGYKGVVLSLEPSGSSPGAPSEVLLIGELPEEITAGIQLVGEIQPGRSVLGELPELLDRQAVHYRSHINNALNSIAGESLSGSKQHSEHVINIIDGRDGELYGDWDDNGRAENPGDDVGLLTYLQLLSAAASSLNEYQVYLGATDPGAAGIAEETDRLVEVVITTRNTAKEITLADSMNVILELGLDNEFESSLAVRDQIGSIAADASALDLAFLLALQPPGS